MSTSQLVALIVTGVVGVLAVLALRQQRQAAADSPAPAPAPREPMRVMRMMCRGFLRIRENGVDREEPLPASPLGHGEFPTACWATSDGTVYAVGKLYSGKPGPDDGVVWKRTPTGQWSIAFQLKDRTL